MYIGQTVWTIGTNPDGVRGVIAGQIAEIGNNHVWLCIPWRCIKFHSRENGEIFHTQDQAQAQLDLINETIDRRRYHRRH